MASRSIVQARGRHGRIASEMLASLVIDRAKRRIGQQATPAAAGQIATYVAAVEAGIGTKRVARAKRMDPTTMRRLMRRVENARDDARLDALVIDVAMGALA
jgi:hypothetical protein